MGYYFSQFGEDKFMEVFFKEGYKGVCVEVGAYDGRSGSNTLHFELKGWRSLCIEPIPKQFEKCKSIRREAENCCISDVEKENVPFYVFQIGDGTNESAISSLEPDKRLIDSHMSMLKGIEPISVKCRTLTSVLDQYNYPLNIDFISIDTENTELNVLKGFDFNKYNVTYFIIENNYNEPYCGDYLKQFGYVKIHRIEINDIFKKIA